MENIKLDNGKFLNRSYGKYEPNITFVSNKEMEKLPWEHNKETGKYFDGNTYSIRGSYRKNGKGTDIFEIGGPTSPHLLLKTSWGGAFNTARGYCNIPNQLDHFLFERRASSNGGGAGNTYRVVKVTWNPQGTVSEDDF